MHQDETIESVKVLHSFSWGCLRSRVRYAVGKTQSQVFAMEADAVSTLSWPMGNVTCRTRFSVSLLGITESLS